MGLRFADRTTEAYEDYKRRSDPDCKNCYGSGVYRYCNAYMASGVTVICECVPEGKVWMWLRKNEETLLTAITIPIGIAFWIWTGVLWWRWLWE